jgi:hypothetical protein
VNKSTCRSALTADAVCDPSGVGRWTAIVAAALFFLTECYRYLKLQRLPDSGLVQYLPDDAFYYLVLGKNYSVLHRWTLDGQAPATGFHLLWAYVIAFLANAHLGFRGTFGVLYFAGAILLTLGLFLTSLVAIRRCGRFAVVGPALMFSTYWALNQANFLMESSLVVFFASAAIYLCFGRSGRSGAGVLAFCSIVGLLGMLSRSDFGLLPLMIVLAFVLENSIAGWLYRGRRTAGDWARPRLERISFFRAPAVFVLAGSILGLASIVAHTYATSGRVVQGSALEKRRWSEETGNPKKEPLLFAASILPAVHPPSDAVKRTEEDGVCLIFLFVFAGISVLTNRSYRTPSTLVLVCASGLTLFGYIWLYRYDSAALQPWYYANLIIPFSVLAGSAMALPWTSWRLLSMLTLGFFLHRTEHSLLQAPWPLQVGFYEAGLYIEHHPELKPVGAWNAGIESYFGHGGVVNLDGLVNDDIYPYSLNDSLALYLSRRGIRHIVDDLAMLDAPIFQVRGGYSKNALTGCIRSETKIWTHPFRNTEDQIMDFALDPECLVRRNSTR